MIQRILVPTDFSPQAENALRVAADLAKKYKAEIYLLHLLDLPLQLADGAYKSSGQELPEALFFMRLAHKRFEETLRQPFLEGITVHETTEFDGAFSGIMDYKEKYGIDLIVMGSHGAQGLHEIFIGSNTEKVVRNSKVPVLVIKKKHDYFDIKHFVFATNAKEESIEAYREALDFATVHHSTLHLLYINTPANFKPSHKVEAQIRQYVAKAGHPDQSFTIYNDNSVEKGILHYAKHHPCDLISAATHGRKGLAHFFNGSISEDLVNHAQKPVLTFKI